MNETTELPLSQYLRIFARRKWWILGITVLVLAAALAVSALQVKRYTATAQVLAQSTALLNNQDQSGITPTLGTTQLATYAQLVTSPAVIQGVRKSLGITGKVPPVAVSLVSGGGTNLIAIAARSTSPTAAARVANGYANAFAAYEHGIATTQANSNVKSYRFDYNQLSQQLKTTIAQHDTSAVAAISAQVALIAQELALAESEAADAPSPITVVSPASIPTSPSSPKPVRNGLLGLVAGILFGLGFAVALDHFDDRLGSAVDVKDVAGDLPVLAAVPRIESWTKPKDPLLVSLVAPSSPDVASYWSLRASLKFLNQERRIRSVVVTSSTDGEGKTATIANLGVVLANSGQRTLMVSCDLRRPRLGTFFKGPLGPGLMSVLLGEVALEDAVTPIQGVPALWILDTGVLPADPHRTLANAATQRVFEELALNFDLVLIDSPPLLPVADALVLGQVADATIVMASFGHTRKRQLRRALEMLDTAHVSVVGLILNEVTRRSSYGYSYYGYGTYSPSSTRKKAAHKKQRPADALLPALNGDAHSAGASQPVGAAASQAADEAWIWRSMAGRADASG
jgi:capsular exopolysaccharide synthesis family protein